MEGESAEGLRAADKHYSLRANYTQEFSWDVVQCLRRVGREIFDKEE